MEGVTTLANIFQEYGWPGLLAISLLIALWFILQRLLKKNSEDNTKALTEGLKAIATNINAQNEYLVQTITDQNVKQQEKMFELLSQSLIKHDKDKEFKHNESVNHRMKVSDQVMYKLYEILNFHKAQRAVVIEFHNSKENLNGLSFVWYDVQYEAHNRKTLPIASRCRDLQLSKLYKVIEDIYQTDGVVKYDQESFKEYGLYNLLYNDIEKEINYLIYLGIYNDSNDLIGLVCLEYLKDELPDEFDEKELNTQVGAISTLLKFNHLDIH